MELFLLTILSAIQFACSAPFLDKSDVQKIKDIVDQEIVKKEIDILIEKRMHMAKSPEETRRYFEKQMRSNNLTNPPVMHHSNDPHPHHPSAPIHLPTHEINHVIRPVETCHDVYHDCKALHEEYDMCSEDRMSELCRDTCGLCPQRAHAAPVDCSTVPFGCCSDHVTPKKDQFGSNCPRCVDTIPALCGGKRQDCNAVGYLGNWMRTNCQKLCGGCAENEEEELMMAAMRMFQQKPCEDSPGQAQFCGSWKEAGLCNIEPLKQHCKKTCGQCEKSPR